MKKKIKYQEGGKSRQDTIPGNTVLMTNPPQYEIRIKDSKHSKKDKGDKHYLSEKEFKKFLERYNKKNKDKKMPIRKMQMGGPNPGMYDQNVIPAGIGSSTSIVYQESNPAVLAAARERLQQVKEEEMSKSEQLKAELDAQKRQDEADIQQAAVEQEQKGQAVGGVLGTAAQAYSQMQDEDEEALLQQEKDKLKTTDQPTITSNAQMPTMQMDTKGVISKRYSSIHGEGAEAWNQMMIDKYGDDIFTRTVDTKTIPELTGSVASQQSVQKGADISHLIADSSQPTYAWNATGTEQLANPFTSGTDAAVTSGTGTATNIGTQAVKSTAWNPNAAVVGGKGVGTGIGKFATSGAGMGMIATGVGMGISALADDDDPTKNTFGEYSGSVISGAGAGATYGSMLGPAGTAIGAVVGGLYGGISKWAGAKKAREKKKELAAIKKRKVAEYNKNLKENIASQVTSARSHELQSKTYSGYDLGRNVTYRGGGMLQPIPQYI